MTWANFSLLFVIAAVKFLTSPVAVAATINNSPEVTFLEIYLSLMAGGLTSASFFYFLSSYFSELSRKKNLVKQQKRIKEGKAPKRIFTKKNKMIVRIKQKLGVWGMALLTASIISIPIGSILSARFFGHKRSTILIIYISILGMGLVLTSIGFLFKF